MRKVIFALTAAFALVAFLSACGMGLEPAKTDTTSVSLSLTVMSPLGSGGSTDAGRAIIPDGGYLYVRMLGGPTANTPRYLGPYQVRTKSSTISITDIPAGQYDGMFLLYADRAVHIEGVATTLGQIFSLPDKDFLAFVEGDDEYEVDVLLAGRASIGMVESPRVVEGKANSFPVTMIPVTPYRIPVWFTGIDIPMYLDELMEGLDGAGYESFKGFIGIEGIQEYVSLEYPDYTGNVRLTFSNESTTESMTVNRLSVYDGEGVPFPVTMSADQKYSLDVPMPEPDLDEIFFYLDVSGGDPAITITLDEGGTEPVDPVDPLPELDEITGSLDLADYMSNFDTVNSVFFSTTSAVSLEELSFWDGSQENAPEGIVGGGDLTETSEGSGVYDIVNASIASESIGSDLYLIVFGEKYGQPVLYASTEQMTVNSSYTEYSPSIMTPLVQYVVVINNGWETNNVGNSITLSIYEQTGAPVLSDEPGTIVQLPFRSYGAIVQVDPTLFTVGTIYGSILSHDGQRIQYNGNGILWPDSAIIEMDFTPIPY